MLMTTHSFVQRPLKLLRWLGLLCCGLAPSVTLAATLHAIIITDTSDPSLHADQDRDNLKQLVANIHEATGLESNSTSTVIIEVVPHSGYEKVKNAVTGLPVTAEDVVIFYYAGHGNNTEQSSWPAMAVEGEDTKDDKLVELNWVKETLSNKSPRLLIAIADTCNEFLDEPSRGEGTILGEGVGSYKQAYRKLFLGYRGVIMAAGAIPEQQAFSNQGGGRFTQQWLTSLKEELKSAEPDWNNIAVGSVKDIPVENPVEARDQKVQSPQMEVKVKAVALADGNEENEDGGSLLLSHNQPPLKPDEMVCAQQSAGWGTCYLGTAEEGGRKWSVFVEAKGWLNQWQGWYYQSSLSENRSKGHFISATTDPKLVPMLTLGGRYDKLSVALTFLSESYTFPKISSWRKELWPIGEGENRQWEDLLVERQSQDTAERVETDVTLGYSILPELQIGIGFKRATLDYDFHGVAILPDSTIFPGGSEKPYDQVTGGQYTIYGLSLNIGGQTCMANWLGVNVSMFGNFSYGALKTKWKWNVNDDENDSDYTTYHSTDLGLSWELSRWQQWVPEIRFGYRAQTIYTDTAYGDGVDTTEGFTLGLRLIF